MPRKKHQPTEKERGQVNAMAAYGVPEDRIALVIGIAPKTLRKHYRRELDTAHTEATAKVAECLWNNATKKNNVSAQIFWMKTRGGWREAPQELQHSGAIGHYDLSKLSNADLKRVEAILSAAAIGGNPSGNPEAGSGG